MSDGPLALTLDVGTSSCRALLWDTNGREIEGVKAQVKYAMQTNADGGMTFAAAELLAHVGDCIDQALAQAGERAKTIGAVGMSSFWHALLPLDADFNPVGPLLNWADQRSSAIAMRLRRDLDAHAIHDRTGCVLHSSYYPAKIVWMRETQPSDYARVRRWASPSEYLFRCWFGSQADAVSLSIASGTGLFHQTRCQWDQETLDALSIPLEMLAPLAPPRKPLQGLAADFAARWPALRDVPFFPAFGDGACGNVGSGCVTPARFAINVGTSGAIRALWRQEPRPNPTRDSASPFPDSLHGEGGGETANRTVESGTELPGDGVDVALAPPSLRAKRSESGKGEAESRVGLGREGDTVPSGLWRYRADAERPLIGAAFSDGGIVYAWLAKTLQLPPPDELEKQIAGMTPGAHGLTFLPFLAGERSLGWNPAARAALTGINLDTSPVEIMRAALEAVALRFALAAQRLQDCFPDVREIVASGGALTHSPAWAQMFADAIGQSVTLAQEAEASSRGAALLALEAAGIIASADSLEARTGQTYTPNPAHQPLYAELLARQQAAYHTLIENEKS